MLVALIGVFPALGQCLVDGNEDEEEEVIVIIFLKIG